MEVGSWELGIEVGSCGVRVRFRDRAVRIRAARSQGTEIKANPIAVATVNNHEARGTGPAQLRACAPNRRFEVIEREIRSIQGRNEGTPSRRSDRQGAGRDCAATQAHP
jgi:hypothetical protein